MSLLYGPEGIDNIKQTLTWMSRYRKDIKPLNMFFFFKSDPEFFYACYYPENEDFTRAVASIVNYFRQNGYPVEMDVMSSNEMVNLGPTRWAELKIKKASKILVFLSPGILRMCGVADEESQSSHQVTYSSLLRESPS